jgi:hypothetical protein
MNADGNGIPTCALVVDDTRRYRGKVRESAAQHHSELVGVDGLCGESHVGSQACDQSEADQDHQRDTGEKVNAPYHPATNLKSRHASS